jgi:hypothetical protein
MQGMLAINQCRIFFTSLLSINITIKIYRTIILPGHGTWSLTLREKHRLRVYDNRVLRRMLGPNREETTREWRRLKNKELLICMPHQMFFMWSNQHK